MSWHYDNRRSSGMLRHPSDGEAWKHFDRVHADFAIILKRGRTLIRYMCDSIYAQMDLTHIFKHPLHLILDGQSLLPRTIFL